MPEDHHDQVAIITGASSGIGLSLASLCAKDGFDLVIASDEARIHDTAEMFRSRGLRADAVEVDLATRAGVAEVVACIGDRPVGALLANAGHGLGKAFLDQSFDDVMHVVNTNIVGTIDLIQQVGQRMRDQRGGRILITGSIAGLMPGTYQAVYNGTKAFIDSFSFALRAELKDCHVTVTCLMPGATDTDFFARADMADTKVGQGPKQDPDDVAKIGYEAMMRGDGDVVTGWQNKLRAAISAITPASVLAEMHRNMAEPGSGTKK